MQRRLSKENLSVSSIGSCYFSVDANIPFQGPFVQLADNPISGATWTAAKCGHPDELSLTIKPLHSALWWVR